MEHVLRGFFPDGTQFEHGSPPELPDAPGAALTLRGRGERRDDWQTRLRTVTTGPDDRTRFPLAGVIESLASVDATVQYQALVGLKPNWEATALDRIEQLKRNRDTPA